MEKQEQTIELGPGMAIDLNPKQEKVRTRNETQYVCRTYVLKKKRMIKKRKKKQIGKGKCQPAEKKVLAYKNGRPYFEKI